MNGLIDQAMDFLADGQTVHQTNNWRYVTIGNLCIGVYYVTGASLTITTQVGSVYQTSSNANITIPFTLNSVLFGDVNVISSSYSVWTAMYGLSTSSLSYRALSTASRSQSTYTITAVVVGLI